MAPSPQIVVGNGLDTFFESLDVRTRIREELAA